MWLFEISNGVWCERIPGFGNGLSPQLIPDAHCGHLLLSFDITLSLFFYIIIVGSDHPFQGGFAVYLTVVRPLNPLGILPI